MSEERLQEIKDSVNFQREILLAHNMRNVCVDEEQELVEEIERLHSIIKEVREYIEHENYKRNILLGFSEKKYTRDILNKVLEILDKV